MGKLHIRSFSLNFANAKLCIARKHYTKLWQFFSMLIQEGGTKMNKDMNARTSLRTIFDQAALDY
ncbi:hypothetical protein KJ898_05710, partial [bacterium]|nr:hypothetical protein [bacterium]